VNDSKPVHIFDHAEIGSTSGDPVALVVLKPGSTSYRYKLKAHRDGKVNSRTSGQVSDVFCSVNRSHLVGWLSYKKGDILHTDGVPIKGEASTSNQSL